MRTLFIVLLALAPLGAQQITVGSKAFNESVVLGEVVALLAKESGANVTHKQGMGGTGDDVANAEIQQQRYFLHYNSQCWSVNLEGREYTRGLVTDRDYRLSLTLKNVGSFLDISGGSSSGD